MQRKEKQTLKALSLNPKVKLTVVEMDEGDAYKIVWYPLRKTIKL